MNVTNDTASDKGPFLQVTLPISLPVAVLFACMSFMIGSINIVYIVVCFKVLKRKFFNLVILSLCHSDAVLGFGCTLYALAPKVELVRSNVLFCKIQVFTLSFSIESTYHLMFLLCLQRYLTVRSYNFGTKLSFEKYKYPIVLGTISYTFALTFGIITFLPREMEGNTVASCNPEDIFGYNNFRYFYSAVFMPMTLIIILVFIFSSLTCKQIYDMFFKKRQQVMPQLSQPNDNEEQANGQNVNFNMFAAKAGPSSTNKSSPGKENTAWAMSVQDEDKGFESGFAMTDLNDICVDDTTENRKSNAAGKKTAKKMLKKEKRYIEDYEETIGKDNQQLSRTEWEKKAFITCMVVAFTAIVFTGPFICSIWVDIITGNPLSMESKMLLFLPISLNIFSNPFVYAWRIPEIRREFKKLFQKDKRNRVDVI